MVGESKREDAKRAIIHVLERAVDPKTGKPAALKYNVLFSRVRSVTGSLSTFDRYLNELKRSHTVSVKDDKEDRRAVAISLNPEEAAAEETLLDILSAIRRISTKRATRSDFEKHMSEVMGEIPHLSDDQEDQVFSHPYMALPPILGEAITALQEKFFQINADRYPKGGFIRARPGDFLILRTEVYESLKAHWKP